METSEKMLEAKLASRNSYNGAISWLRAIAGLSIINTGIVIFGGGVSFIFGLGLSQLIDSLIYYSASTVWDIVGVLANLCLAGFFVFLWYKAKLRKRWAIITGLCVYGADAVLVLLFKDYLGFAFHIFALIAIFSALDKLKAMEEIENAISLGETLPNVDLGQTSVSNKKIGGAFKLALIILGIFALFIIVVAILVRL